MGESSPWKLSRVAQEPKGGCRETGSGPSVHPPLGSPASPQPQLFDHSRNASSSCSTRSRSPVPRAAHRPGAILQHPLQVGAILHVARDSAGHHIGAPVPETDRKPRAHLQHALSLSLSLSLSRGASRLQAGRPMSPPSPWALVGVSLLLRLRSDFQSPVWGRGGVRQWKPGPGVSTPSPWRFLRPLLPRAPHLQAFAGSAPGAPSPRFSPGTSHPLCCHLSLSPRPPLPPSEQSGGSPLCIPVTLNSAGESHPPPPSLRHVGDRPCLTYPQVPSV